MDASSAPGVGASEEKPLRALFMIGSVGFGGAEEQLTELLTRCRPEIEPLLVTLSAARESAERIDRLRKCGVPHLVLSPKDGPRALRAATAAARLERAVREFRPHVASAWLEESSLFMVPLARVRRLPVVVVRLNVGGSPAERSGPLRRAVRALERRATIVVGNSEAVLADARGRGIACPRLRLVWSGCAERPPLPIPPGPEIALGYVAQFRREKGHMRLLDTLRHLKTATPWRVDLTSDGPLVPRVRAEISRLGLDDRVRLVGHVPDIREFWAGHHIGVLLSDYEGVPNALIEAAMAGRPMIGTDTGGTPEVVVPGTGFVVPLDGREKATDALRQLIEDEDLRRRMGDAAHRHVADRFSLEGFVAGHVAALREAHSLSGRDRASRRG
jgi:glycosyltransferase involved in cell wall biosynthesis